MSLITRPQQRKLHAMARQVFGGDRDAYLEMLWGVAKVKSSTELTFAKASLVIDHLQKCLGQRPQGRHYRRLHSKAPQPQAGKPGPPRITARQMWEIRELWPKVCRAEDHKKALSSFLARMRLPENLVWLTLNQAQKVIEALKQMAARAALKAMGGK
ncbi:MAG: regulatory protein GemA [Deltaproteobacteria bacterium]|nr:regulatory protein GemA [Deltaproteobacteria bacterium]